MKAGNMHHPMKFIINTSLINDSQFILQKLHKGRI